MIAAAISRPGGQANRPGRRFRLIDEALAPLASPHRGRRRGQRDLAIVVSAEAFFTLTDTRGLDPEGAIATAVHAARTLTAAMVAEMRDSPSDER